MSSSLAVGVSLLLVSLPSALASSSSWVELTLASSHAESLDFSESLHARVWLGDGSVYEQMLTLGELVQRFPARQDSEALRSPLGPPFIGLGSPYWIAVGTHTSQSGFHWLGTNTGSACPYVLVEPTGFHSPGLPGLPAGGLVRVTGHADLGAASATVLLLGYDAGLPSIRVTDLAAHIESPAFRLQEAGMTCRFNGVYWVGYAWVTGDGVVVGCAEEAFCDVSGFVS